MIDGSAPANGYQYTYNWLVGGDVNCSTAAVNICSINKAGVIATVAWATTGSGTFTVPAGATVQTTAAGVTTPVVAGTPVTIGSMPTWFGAAS
jgi:ACR3 family arsenite efflux pump ArsB